MFERFTERARRLVVCAQDEALLLRHDYIGTEHLLLGMLAEREGLAARVLESLGLTLDATRETVVRTVGIGDGPPPAGQIPFTPRAKKVLELALREALSLGHNYIGTEHILLGLVRENSGVAARILLDSGLDDETIRNEIIRMLSGPGRRAAAGGGPPRPPALTWEYRVEPWPDADAVDLLNEAAAEGWQLVATVPCAVGIQAVFLRPRRPGVAHDEPSEEG